MNFDKKKTFNILIIVVLPVIMFIASPYWSQYTSKPKQLTYDIFAKRELGTRDIRSGSWPEVKYQYNDKVLDSGFMIYVTIENTGGAPIARSDFDAPIEVHINDAPSIIDGRVTLKSPENLPVELARSSSGLIIKPLLLNPGDSFVIEILGSKDFDISNIESRISGIDSIVKSEPAGVEGLYLKRVRSGQPGMTLESEILRIHPVIPLATMLAGMLISLIVVNIPTSAFSAYRRGAHIKYFCFIYNYMVVLVSASLLAIIAKLYNVPALLAFAALIAVATIALMINAFLKDR